MQLRTEFEVAGQVRGDALLRTANKDFSIFEIVLDDGQHFTLEGKRVKGGGIVWGAEPYQEYEPLAQKIGKRLERAMA